MKLKFTLRNALKGSDIAIDPIPEQDPNRYAIF
jgi:hypothetical protein